MFAISTHKTAILFFARSSKEEASQKSICNGIQLFDALTTKTIATVSKSKLPYFHFTEHEQHGISFGERFTNALQAVFNKGFENVITIGNDSPQLTVSHILLAKTQIERGKFVLGPSVDGGFYLMGISKSQFNTQSFKKLAWQTAFLSKQLIQLARNKNIEVITLNTLFDIDSVQDVKSLLANTYQLPKQLVNLFLLAISAKKASYRNALLLYSNYFSETFKNKGSPCIGVA